MTTDNFCFYSQNRQVQTYQTGGQWYSNTPPFKIPWLERRILTLAVLEASENVGVNLPYS